jgi:Xaa-Pro dipeptidase
VTCSFPANGIFTEKYKAVYESVLNAQRAVYAKIEPGVSWVDCHIVAELEIVKGLYAIGVVQLPDGVQLPGGCKSESGDTSRLLERLVREHRLGAVFMPHGLGHLIGIDAHDVGGYLEGTPPRSTEAGLRSLRTARVLEENMVVTVEPGCYFIDHLLDEALEEGHPLAPFLNKELIDREYRGYGGVRLEDVVAITAKNPCSGGGDSDDANSHNGRGYSCVRNFTLCPRTVREVEAVMDGGKWPPMVDEAPELRRLRLTKPWAPLPPPPSR